MELNPYMSQRAPCTVPSFSWRSVKFSHIRLMYSKNILWRYQSRITNLQCDRQIWVLWMPGELYPSEWIGATCKSVSGRRLIVWVRSTKEKCHCYITYAVCNIFVVAASAWQWTKHSPHKWFVRLSVKDLDYSVQSLDLISNRKYSMIQ